MKPYRIHDPWIADFYVNLKPKAYLFKGPQNLNTNREHATASCDFVK